MRQNDAQTGKIMSTELKSHQHKQQMTFSDSEINSNAASLFSNVFLLSSFHSFNNKQHRAEENVIIMGPKKNKIKEESKKKSKEPKNAPKNQQRWKQRISSREIMIILKAHGEN